VITNLLILLVVIGLAVLFGWLTYRAIRARRLWVKIVGGIAAGLLTLVFAAVATVGAIGLAKMNAVTAIPVPNLKVAGTPEQVARGKYIASLGCVGCHGVKEQFPLAGGNDFAGEIPMPVGAIVANNLTPGGVLKDRSDGELFRAIRHSYGKDGRLLSFMSQLSYRQLSDDDIQAVIAFLRTQEPVASAGPQGDHINMLGALVFFGAGMLPAPVPVENTITAPPEGATPEYGKYAATFGDCRGCHGPDMTGMPATQFGPAVPNPRPSVGTWTQEQFIQTMRTGVRPSGAAFSPAMPWQGAAQMTDSDLTALYVYLTAPAK
jgi:mono/diheme cytochrome c family protein